MAASVYLSRSGAGSGSSDGSLVLCHVLETIAYVVNYLLNNVNWRT